MNQIKFVAGALGALALAVPGVAAAHGKPTVAAVKTHVRASDRALDTVAVLAHKGKDAEAERLFGAGRAQLVQAKADAAKLVRGADSARERALAAQAQKLVADEQNKWIDELPDLLPLVEGRFEARLSGALLADVKGRDAALETLVSLLERGVPAEAQLVIAKAVSQLATQRDDEVAAIIELLASGKVEQASKAQLVACLKETIDGQTKAAKRFAAAAEVSASAAAILEQAYHQVESEQQAHYEAITTNSDELGAAYRAAVERIAGQAQQAAEQLKADYPQTGFPGSGDQTGGSTPSTGSPPNSGSQPSIGGQPPVGGTGNSTP